MKKKLLSALLAMSMLLAMTGCGGNNNSASDNNSQSDTVSQPEVTSESSQPEDSSEVIEEEVYEGRVFDIKELYQAILAEQPEDMEPLDMIDESENKQLIEANYPNFYDCNYEQVLYYTTPVPGYPCEIMMVQTKTGREADYIEEEFLARIERAAAEETDPEYVHGWVNLAEIQREGNFVVMIVLPEGYEIPFIFALL